MAAGFRKTIAAVAILAAAGTGLAAGYLTWGWPTNWYAGHNVSTLPPGPENDLIRYGEQLVATPRARSARARPIRPSVMPATISIVHTATSIAVSSRSAATGVDVRDVSDDGRRAGDVDRRTDQRLHDAEHERQAVARGRPRDGRHRRVSALHRPEAPQGVRVAGMGLPPLRKPARAPDRAGRGGVRAATAPVPQGPGSGRAADAPPGVGYEIPPLWGDDSFNSAAGMSRLETAAAFIRANMPIGTDYREPILTEQQAWDVAAFVTSQPRPALRAAPVGR